MSRNSSITTKNHILDAAWTLISDKGAEVSLQEIADAATVSRQAVYFHFGSRSGLLMALVKRVDERFEIKERLFTCFDTPDPRQRLEDAISVWVDFVVTIYPVASDLIRLRETDAAAAAAWEDRMAELRRWLRILTLSLHKDGALLPEWSAKNASEYLWAAFSVQIWGLLTRDCQWPSRKAAKILRQAICRSLLS